MKNEKAFDCFFRTLLAQEEGVSTEPAVAAVASGTDVLSGSIQPCKRALKP
jgi:hypothetical protein